ncbi:MAG: methionyl-tRNA formyltransferase [Candidatus Buchananbacteria bacterium RIFCSPLOWO2_02_FULL_46_11b]|uniref:Methionyl-tRNA formyltransferase n=2 Tax=Candidatus Buchananiibacteriota TaxID=1817903 RepID=A0A1G1YN06_9BACT|nr:MAG: methionyl-tRNA formyltransferase [Candidatus Buchananbacteria bacterium RIFCSPLOWO2_01_FULL_45_31]OGY56232.1 MAG: methionyl-tRNA formyltransferase [Candidatus Buchananbacteria bacterium RIFCSPLOWO2_02_FULL_46_11b]
MLQKPKIIFWGTPEFAVPALQALIDNDLKPVLVVTQPDKPIGRKQEVIPSPIKKIASENNIPIFQPLHQKDLPEICRKYQPDVCVLAAFGLIIPKNVLNKPACGFLNIHPSLLPKYRGSSPIQTALLNNDKETGVSLIQLTNKVDAGPIIAQKTLAITNLDNAQTLSKRLAELGADLLIEILPDFAAGKIVSRVQDESRATYTKKISREDGRINWQKEAGQIERQFRAFYPWPGIFTLFNGKRLKIANLSVLEDDFGAELAPGAVFLGPEGELAVKAGSGAVILNSVQPEGKKEMPGNDFLRGQKELAGAVFS